MARPETLSRFSGERGRPRKCGPVRPNHPSRGRSPTWVVAGRRVSGAVGHVAGHRLGIRHDVPVGPGMGTGNPDVEAEAAAEHSLPGVSMSS